MGFVRNKHVIWAGCLVAIFGVVSLSAPQEQLVYHQIKTDADGKIVPWYSSDPGEAYNAMILKIWHFWKNMKSCPNGVKYYMQHQVWDDPEEDPRGLGGDQLAMALSSWNLLYAYSGDRSLVENMQYIADYYIAHGLSKPTALWPNLFYPYNMELHSGVYDGDMRAGKGVLQPDKAASFAAELVTLYKITGNAKYLQTAVDVADTLAKKITPGDRDRPPWPYRVNAETGEVKFSYTTNYTGALRLFDNLIALHSANAAEYARARNMLTAWLQKYPIREQKWGPFFEDVGEWSDTEINADTMAWYILEHPEWDANWREDAKAILRWSSAMFDNHAWEKFGVLPTNEQTAYRVPGNSHSSRHASVLLIYAEKTGDTSAKEAAIRELNWATYSVAEDGRNRYPYDMVWLTDGYGDYVRHYLRAMAAAPELAPKFQNHLLRISSVVKTVAYSPEAISYTTFDSASRELLRVAFTPTVVTAGGKRLTRVADASDLDRQEGYAFNEPGDAPGVLRIRHDESGDIEIRGTRTNQPPIAESQTLTVNQNSSVEIRLAAHDDGLPHGSHLTYSVTGPYAGKITGMAPTLTYTPQEDFLGTDLLPFRASDGALESNTAQVTIKVVRSNLAQLADAQPFTTEDPQTGATGVFTLAELADGDLETSVDAAADRDAAREVSVGVLWPEAQSVRQVVFRQGAITPTGSGLFSPGLRLETTEDGSTWHDASDVSLAPAYLGDARVGMLDFIFTLPSEVQVQGVRVTGKVGRFGQSTSTYPRVREFEVYSSLASSRPPELDYGPQDATVSEGGQAIFGVRPHSVVFVAYQWQRSRDKGKTWEDIPGANSSYYQTPPARYPADNGAEFRCQVSNGTSPDAISRPATLRVLAPGSATPGR